MESFSSAIGDVNSWSFFTLLLGGPVFLSIRGSRSEWLISLLRVLFSLGMFYTTSYLLMLLCMPGASFLFSLLTLFCLEEDLQHLLLKCPFVRDLWYIVSFAFGHRLYLDGPVLDLW